jgi:hypothetical protein
MFHLQYFDKDQLISLFEYPNLKEAKAAIKENDVWNASTRYKITDVQSGTVQHEADFAANDGIYQMMASEPEPLDDFEVEIEDFEETED